jgi:hypothetical protein
MMICESAGDQPPQTIPATATWIKLSNGPRAVPGAFLEPPPATADELNRWPGEGDSNGPGAAT